MLDIFNLGLNKGCRCPDCWHDNEDIRAEMRHAGAMRRRADAELLEAGITEFVSRDPFTGERLHTPVERYLLKMGERGTFPIGSETNNA